MPELEIFRKRQKLIFWLVALMVIPSFVLVWGVGGNPGQSFQDPVVFEYDGKKLTYSEYTHFRRRLAAASGNRFDDNHQPLDPRLMYYVDQNPSALLYSMEQALVYSIMAEKAGVVISPLEESHYLRREHPRLMQVAGDEDAFRRAIRDESERAEISPEDFRRGVRELLAIRRLIQIDNMTAYPTVETCYLFYALGRAEAVTDRLRFAVTAEAEEAARAAFAALPAETRNAEIRRLADAFQADQRFREPARFRFEYLVAPYGAFAKESLTETEIRRQFDNHPDLYVGRTYEEAKDDVREDAFLAARRQHAEIVVRNEIDAVLARYAARDEGAPPREELARTRELSLAGVTAGVSGPEPATVAELETNPYFTPDPDPEGGPSVADKLLELDRLPEAQRAAILERWKKFFDYGPSAAGALGRLRIRLIDYTPSRPMEENDDGSWPESLAAAATDEWVRETVDNQIREDAQAAAARFRDGDAEALAGAERVVFRYNAQAFPSVLINMRAGEVSEALPFVDGETRGVELLALSERRVPGHADWQTQDALIRRYQEAEVYKYFAGRLGLTPMYTLTVQPSLYYSHWLNLCLNKGVLWVDFEHRFRTAQ